jgi:hypothetical protein
MAPNKSIIGRKHEMELLQERIDSPKAEFIAVYGRRRIGKTYLIDKMFEGRFAFYMTGIYEGTRKEQLANFANQLSIYAQTASRKVPNDWMEAFFLLRQYLETLPADRTQILFIDELPWFDTPRSRFLKAFELFWNEWASKQSRLKLIACGSATTWMTHKLLGNKGGLHNRVTQSIYLRPFNLCETEEFLLQRNFSVSRSQVMEVYMSLGGTPYYLDMLRKSLSMVQNIDALFFSEDAPLRSEYEFLFKSLFNESQVYRRVVETLARKMKGMSRQELITEMKVEDNGYLTEVLSNLCSCDFIRKYNAFGKAERDVIYQLTDLYSLFYLRFVKNYHGGDEHYWSHRQGDLSAWEGYAFEQVCLHHIPQIKRKLGIQGVLTNVCSWMCRPYTDEAGIPHPGAQIDLVIDRGDKAINLCEMKFTDKEFVITTEYAQHLLNRRDTFRAVTGTKKTLQLTLVTAAGLARQAGWQQVQNEVTGDDLFEES